MNSTRLPTIAFAAVLGGLAYLFCGTLQITQDFEGTHNTIDTTAEYLVTGGLAAALFLTVASYRVIGALAGRPRAAVVAMVPQVVLGTMCVVSIIRGEDPSFFNAVAPVCLLTWLVSSIVLAVGLHRRQAVPTKVAIAIPLLVPVTIALSPIGGPILTGAFWIAAGTHVLRAGAPSPTITAPAAA